METLALPVEGRGGKLTRSSVSTAPFKKVSGVLSIVKLRNSSVGAFQPISWSKASVSCGLTKFLWPSRFEILQV